MRDHWWPRFELHAQHELLRCERRNCMIVIEDELTGARPARSRLHVAFGGMLRHAHVITLHNTVVGDSHDAIGISASRLLRLGAKAAMTYGQAIMGVSNSMLRDQRRIATAIAAPGSGCGGQNLDIALMLAD